VPVTLFLGRVILDVLGGREEAMRPQRAREFMELIASLGPAFIKAGQALSSRPDLLPPEYLRELVKLQDRVEPFGNAEAFAIIEAQLGERVEDVFDRVDPAPVAAASIGQVYKGFLKSGEAVAIKVQRPDLQERIALDIYILRQLSGLLSQAIALLRRDIDLQSVVEEFGKLIYEEIDYLQEARNAEEFAELYGGKPDIYVPKVHWRLCRRKILVMEWVDGVRLTSPSLPAATKTKLVNSLVQCSLQQMLEKGFFHADPHGGNLLATADGRLVYLDFGMMSSVDVHQARSLPLPPVLLASPASRGSHPSLACVFPDSSCPPLAPALRHLGGGGAPREPRLCLALAALRAPRLHPTGHGPRANPDRARRRAPGRARCVRRHLQHQERDR